MFKTGESPTAIMEQQDLGQVDDLKDLEKTIDQVIDDNKKVAADYLAGKEAALKFLMGQVMSKTKGKANPQTIQEILKKKLS